jgi:hypothetical protein
VAPQSSRRLAGRWRCDRCRQAGALVNANRGKLGWTYSHKPVDAKHIANRQAIADANTNGFVVNLSADTLAEADTLAALNVGPVVVVLDAQEGTKADTTTPEGRKVITCPATYRDDVTCASCLLCARAKRVIVGFPCPHGTARPLPLWRAASQRKIPTRDAASAPWWSGRGRRGKVAPGGALDGAG